MSADLGIADGMIDMHWQKDSTETKSFLKQ
jgi:hypothetical protein